MQSFFFYLFSAVAVGGGVALIVFRNPVSSAMSMVVSFIGLAGLFIGLNAYFVGILQILVYTGAVMVLFLFIIMLLDLKSESRFSIRPVSLAAGIVIPVLFVVQLIGLINTTPNELAEDLDLEGVAKTFHGSDKIKKKLKQGTLPDVALIGETFFETSSDETSDENSATRSSQGYHLPLQMTGVLLLVATIGVVVLSQKRSKIK